MPSTRANEVRACVWRRVSLTISSTRTPCTVKASAINERWHRHGTASAHIVNKTGHRVGIEQSDKLLKGSRGVSNREDEWLRDLRHLVLLRTSSVALPKHGVQHGTGGAQTCARIDAIAKGNSERSSSLPQHRLAEAELRELSSVTRRSYAPTGGVGIPHVSDRGLALLLSSIRIRFAL